MFGLPQTRQTQVVCSETGVEMDRLDKLTPIDRPEGRLTYCLSTVNTTGGVRSIPAQKFLWKPAIDVRVSLTAA
jgi:hypothetical protein